MSHHSTKPKLLIGGLPRAGKTSLAKRLEPHVDRTFDLDFYYMWKRCLDDALGNEYFSERSHLGTSRVLEISGHFEESLSEQLRKKMDYAKCIVKSLLHTLTWNEDTGVIEGWMLMPDTEYQPYNVDFVFLTVSESLYLERLNNDIDDFNDLYSVRFSHLRKALLDRATKIGAKIMTYEAANDYAMEILCS